MPVFQATELARLSKSRIAMIDIAKGKRVEKSIPFALPSNLLWRPIDADIWMEMEICVCGVTQIYIRVEPKGIGRFMEFFID